MGELEAAVDLTTIAAHLAIPLERVQAGCRSLIDGDTLITAVREFGLRIDIIRVVAAHLGWSFSWRRYRVGKLQRSEVLRRLAAGEAQTAIAREAGVTRSLVGQVANAAGLFYHTQVELRRAQKTVSRAERQAAREQQRAAVQAHRLVALAARWSEARRMWDAGSTIAAIAAAHGIPTNSMAWCIHETRNMLGAAWFSRRGRPTVPRQLQPIPDLDEIRRRWFADESHAAIAVGIGITSDQLRMRLRRIRKRFGRDVLPQRISRTAHRPPEQAQAADEQVSADGDRLTRTPKRNVVARALRTYYVRLSLHPEEVSWLCLAAQKQDLSLGTFCRRKILQQALPIQVRVP